MSTKKPAKKKVAAKKAAPKKPAKVSVKKPSKPTPAKKAPKPKKPAVAKKTPKKTAPAKAKATANVRKSASGVEIKFGDRHELRQRVEAELKKAGPSGLHVKELAEKTGRTLNGIYVFFSTTAKDMTNIVKVSAATYALREPAPAKGEKK